MSCSGTIWTYYCVETLHVVDGSDTGIDDWFSIFGFYLDLAPNVFLGIINNDTSYYYRKYIASFVYIPLAEDSDKKKGWAWHYLHSPP